jgi:hypothetical protein
MRFQVKPHSGILLLFLPTRGPSARDQASCPRFLFVGGAVLILGAFVLFGRPGVWYQLRYGRPLMTTEKYLESNRLIKQGMTFDEVRTALGEPHEEFSNHDGTTSWRYFVPSSLSPIMDGFLGVEFGREGHMTGSWIP